METILYIVILRDVQTTHSYVIRCMYVCACVCFVNNDTSFSIICIVIFIKSVIFGKLSIVHYMLFYLLYNIIWFLQVYIYIYIYIYIYNYLCNITKYMFPYIYIIYVYITHPYIPVFIYTTFYTIITIIYNRFMQ